jgi:hypothetical protein
MVGARDSVPSLGPRSDPEPGRGGGVASTVFEGFGDGAVDDVVVLVARLDVCFLSAADAMDATHPALVLVVGCAGAELFSHPSACRSGWGALCGAGTIVLINIGDEAVLLGVGDGGTEVDPA